MIFRPCKVAKNDFEVFGLEPDKNIFDETVSRGLPVCIGCFPDKIEGK
jgi:hypothetical protein